jgi:hypothetical protein
MLDIIDLGEFASRVGGDELLELIESLTTEIGTIHEEEDTLGPGVFNEPVGEAASGVGLSGTSCHLDQ